MEHEFHILPALALMHVFGAQKDITDDHHDTFFGARWGSKKKALIYNLEPIFLNLLELLCLMRLTRV